VLLVSPELAVQPGPAAEPIISLFRQQTAAPTAGQEFIHVQLPASVFSMEQVGGVLRNTPETELGAFLVLRDPGAGWVPFAMPAVVLRQASATSAPPRLVIRMNCLGLLAKATADQPVAAHLVLVGWKAPV
jgi:hypothetical protein